VGAQSLSAATAVCKTAVCKTAVCKTAYGGSPAVRSCRAARDRRLQAQGDASLTGAFSKPP
jgi:hypothetical protein